MSSTTRTFAGALRMNLRRAACSAGRNFPTSMSVLELALTLTRHVSSLLMMASVGKAGAEEVGAEEVGTADAFVGAEVSAGEFSAGTEFAGDSGLGAG